MLNIFLIALGGAIGAIARYGLSNLIYALWHSDFPLGTLTVNAIGCFLVGLISIKLIQYTELTTELRNLLIIGFLGAFSTFSSFSLETIDLFQSGYIFSGIINIFSTLILCLSFTTLGIFLGK